MKSTRANRILSIVLSLSIVIGITALSRETVLAATDTSSGLTYTITSGVATITGFTAPAGFSGTLVIPNTLGGASVTSIGENAFHMCTSLTSVTIPSSVTSIGDGVFQMCTSLTSVTIPSSVTSIGGGTFFYCISLTGITISSKVTNIGEDAFYFCTSLKSITVDAANTVYKSISGILYSKDGTKLICCPGGQSGSITIPSSVKIIESGAFDWCAYLTGVTIPSSVTSIGEYAFYACDDLACVTIKGTVTSIGGSAFDTESATLKFVVPTGKTTYYQSLLNANVMGDTTAIVIEVFSAPTNLKAVSAGYNSNKLTWTAVLGATGYEIYRSTSSTSGFICIATATASYTNTGLTTGKTYYYKIKAYKIVGTTKIYSAATAAVSAKPIPATPTGLKAVSAGYNSSKLTWTAVPGATGYVIYRSTSSTSGFISIGTSTSASYTNTGLTTGKTYYYKIKAYRTVGTTKIYSAITAAVITRPIPATPTALKAARASATSIKVTWTAVPGATGYVIYRSASLTGAFLNIGTSTTASFTNTGLTTGKTYYYKVKAYRTVGTTKIYSAVTVAVGAKP